MTFETIDYSKILIYLPHRRVSLDIHLLFFKSTCHSGFFHHELFMMREGEKSLGKSVLLLKTRVAVAFF